METTIKIQIIIVETTNIKKPKTELCFIGGANIFFNKLKYQNINSLKNIVFMNPLVMKKLDDESVVTKMRKRINQKTFIIIGDKEHDWEKRVKAVSDKLKVAGAKDKQIIDTITHAPENYKIEHFFNSHVKNTIGYDFTTKNEHKRNANIFSFV